MHLHGSNFIARMGADATGEEPTARHEMSDAKTEISRFFKQSGRVIIPLTVQEIAPPSPAAVSLRSALDYAPRHLCPPRRFARDDPRWGISTGCQAD